MRFINSLFIHIGKKVNVFEIREKNFSVIGQLFLFAAKPTTHKPEQEVKASGENAGKNASCKASTTRQATPPNT